MTRTALAFIALISTLVLTSIVIKIIVIKLNVIKRPKITKNRGASYENACLLARQQWSLCG